ncbi:Uncharacterised protein [Escherichia coli]|nr:hypothetical protein [Escherichia coli]SQY55135.1 Uncharacterised protein [Escherichia coli]SQY97591.1 Uncharacterised protein [Escherichia coli]STH76706.1 Uncharacterised protein [Escherichia coli]
MLRIGQVETSATADGKYTDGSVAGGIAATRLRAAAFNAIQEELANIVESAEMELDPDDMTQVLTALNAQFLTRSNAFADIKKDGEQAIDTALANLGFATNDTSQLLPGGKKFIWGSGRYEVSDGSTGTIISFPTPFPSKCFLVLAIDGGVGSNRISASPTDKNSFRCWAKSESNAYGTTNFRYLAIGE